MRFIEPLEHRSLLSSSAAHLVLESTTTQQTLHGQFFEAGEASQPVRILLSSNSASTFSGTLSTQGRSYYLEGNESGSKLTFTINKTSAGDKVGTYSGTLSSSKELTGKFSLRIGSGLEMGSLHLNGAATSTVTPTAPHTPGGSSTAPTGATGGTTTTTTGGSTGTGTTVGSTGTGTTIGGTGTGTGTTVGSTGTGTTVGGTGTGTTDTGPGGTGTGINDTGGGTGTGITGSTGQGGTGSGIGDTSAGTGTGITDTGQGGTGTGITDTGAGTGTGFVDTNAGSILVGSTGVQTVTTGNVSFSETAIAA